MCQWCCLELLPQGQKWMYGCFSGTAATQTGVKSTLVATCPLKQFARVGSEAHVDVLAG